MAISFGQPCPKPSRLARLERVRSSKAEDTRKLAAFRRAVWARDEGKCRVCGVRCLRTLTLDPKRGEVHHLRGRNVAPEDRYTVSKAVLLCAVHHEQAQRHKVTIPRRAVNEHQRTMEHSRHTQRPEHHDRGRREPRPDAHRVLW